MTSNLTVGKPLKLILTFAIPLLIGNVFQQFYNMADSVIVGKTIGKNALAAVGASGSIVFLIMGIIQGLTNGFSVVTAQYYGANDMDKARKSVATSIVLAAIIGGALTLISVFGVKPLLTLMQTPENVMDRAYLYVVIIFAGTLALVFYNMFSSILRAFGDSRTPLMFLIVASLLNIGLDFLFILVFKMDVDGAAYATIIAQGLSAIACLLYMRAKYKEIMPRRGDWKLNGRECFKHIRVGLPMSFQFMVIAVGLMVLQMALNAFQEDYMAAFTAASKIDQLATQTMVSIGMALATYTAQNYGAGKFDRIKRGVFLGFLIMMGLAVFGFLLMTFAGPYICLLFVDASETVVVTEAANYLRIVSRFYPVLGCIFLFRNVLQGMGNGVAPMIGGTLELGMRIVGALVLAQFIGFVGLCYTGPIAWIAGAGTMIPAFFIVFNKQRKRAEQAKSEAVEPAQENVGE